MTEFTWRVMVFCIVFGALCLWQAYWPRQPLSDISLRWRHNLSLFALGALVVRIGQPLLLAWFGHVSDIGILDWLQWPAGITIILSLILLDGVIYLQHRLCHGVPWLWRIHRVHHSDPALDTTTALRFHPLEIFLSLCLKGSVIVVLGIPPIAVLLFDILLNAAAMFNHSNIQLSPRVEARLRRWIVTPEHHRIHHSRVIHEANSNYGFCLSCWDRWLGSYVHASGVAVPHFQVGMPQTKTYAPKHLKALLGMPFWGKRQSRMHFR